MSSQGKKHNIKGRGYIVRDMIGGGRAGGRDGVRACVQGGREGGREGGEEGERGGAGSTAKNKPIRKKQFWSMVLGYIGGDVALADMRMN